MYVYLPMTNNGFEIIYVYSIHDDAENSPSRTDFL